jgi:hypothetical protein
MTPRGALCLVALLAAAPGCLGADDQTASSPTRYQLAVERLVDRVDRSSVWALPTRNEVEDGRSGYREAARRLRRFASGVRDARRRLDRLRPPGRARSTHRDLAASISRLALAADIAAGRLLFPQPADARALQARAQTSILLSDAAAMNTLSRAVRRLAEL